MSQAGFVDFEDCLEQLNACGNPLEQLSAAVGFELFRRTLTAARRKERQSNAGRKPYDVVLMIKILVLQSLYNLSDHQVRDRNSFMAFLGLRPGDAVPDEKTVWLFREILVQQELIDELFVRFERELEAKGFAARKGHIADSSIMPAPKQRNSRNDNYCIKRGQRPPSFDKKPCKKRKKDTDARWLKKHDQSHFGYKNHVRVDVQHKFIRANAVTNAATHDSQVIDRLLPTAPTGGRAVYGDSAYCSAAIGEMLEERGYVDRIHRKATRDHPLAARSVMANRSKSKVRARVEHVFGRQAQAIGGAIVRTIGLARAEIKDGLRNLVYNLDRFAMLMRRHASTAQGRGATGARNARWDVEARRRAG